MIMLIYLIVGLIYVGIGCIVTYNRAEVSFPWNYMLIPFGVFLLISSISWLFLEWILRKVEKILNMESRVMYYSLLIVHFILISVFWVCMVLTFSGKQVFESIGCLIGMMISLGIYQFFEHTR